MIFTGSEVFIAAARSAELAQREKQRAAFKEQMEKAKEESQAQIDEVNAQITAQRRKWFLQDLGTKEIRMDDRMARRREQIWKRNWSIVGWVFFWLTMPPVLVAGIATIWRVCAWVVAT